MARHSTKLIPLTVSFSCLCRSLFATASTTHSINLSKLVDSLDISSEIMVLEDPNAAFSVEKVQELGGVFFKPEDEIANFGFSKSAWWAKFTINNDLGSAQKVYLEHSYPVIDYVSLYFLHFFRWGGGRIGIGELVEGKS